MGFFSIPRRVAALLLLGLMAQRGLASEALSDASLRSIPSGADDFDIHTGALLAPILVPRVPGTKGSQAVGRHFVTFFQRALPKWSIEMHHSVSTTPASEGKDVPFTNMIFRRDPPWARKGDVTRLTLVAHYDSLSKPEGFIGAIDSAASCAMLLHVAQSLDEAMTRKWDAMNATGKAGMGFGEEKGIQIVFLDGEEAFGTWSDEDSLYGARALAGAWEREVHPDYSIHHNQLESIRLFVLLDLLGATDPHVPSYFPSTHWAYQAMAKIEERMRKLDLLQSTPQSPFLPESEQRMSQYRPGYIADDHIPFMKKGVDVLHLIPMPFPKVWHTIDDDAEHLDIGTVDDWAKIVTAFTAEWLELDSYIEAPVETPVEEKDVGKDEKKDGNRHGDEL